MFFRPMLLRRAVGAGAATTLNPADKNANITLSNGNLSFVSVDTAQNVGVRATKSLSGGKRYFETTAARSADFNAAYGLAKSIASLDVALGADTNSIAIYVSRLIYYNSVATTTPEIFSGDKVGVAIDLGLNIVWFSINGVWTLGDPASTSGGQSIGAGPWFPAVCGSNNNGGTVNFGASAFAYPVPSGFSAWG